MPFDELLKILLLPIVQAAFLGLGAFVFSAIVGAVMRGLGVDTLRLPGLAGFRWSSAAATLALLVGLTAAVAVGFEDARGLALMLGGLLVRLGTAGACVFLALWAMRTRETLAEEQGSAERARTLGDRWKFLAVGAAAGLIVVMGAGGIVWGAVLLMVFAYVLTHMSGEPARVMRDRLRDIAAGIDLRARLRAGDTLRLEGEEFTVSMLPGFVQTRLQPEGGTARRFDNHQLLLALPAPDTHTHDDQPAPVGPLVIDESAQ